MTESYSYDSGDKLTGVTWTGGSKSYGYDGCGRTTSVTTSAGTTSLTYDYQNRITGITYPSTATNAFSYNGFDTRVCKTDSAGTATYKRLGAGVTAPVISDGSATYTPGISERRGSTTTDYHSGLKNADSQTGSSQTITASRSYDAFGNVVSSTGTWNGPFGYAGEFGYQEDGDSGLKLLGHRYLDSSTGRFLTRDLAKQGRNYFTYCDNNPTGFFDSTGYVPDILKKAWGFITDSGKTGVILLSVITVAKPIACFLEAGYEAHLGSARRQKIDNFIDGGTWGDTGDTQGEERRARVKQINNYEGTLSDAGGFMASWWRVFVRLW